MTRRRRRGLRRGAGVLILTTFDLDEYVYEWLQAGASCFLIKNAPAEQLVEAIRVVAAGDSLRLDPGLLSLTLERVKLHVFRGSCAALTTRLELDYKGLDHEAKRASAASCLERARSRNSTEAAAVELAYGNIPPV